MFDQNVPNLPFSTAFRRQISTLSQLVSPCSITASPHCSPHESQDVIYLSTPCNLLLQEAALAAADSVDPVAQRIGAVNTLVRQVWLPIP